MPVGRGVIAGGQFSMSAGVVLVGIAPILVFYLRHGGASLWLNGAVLALQIVAIVCLLARGLPVRSRTVLAFAALGVVAAAGVVLQIPASSVGLAVGGVCHAAAYSGLLIWFGRTLLGDREPAVTGFARRMRRVMPAKVVCYTRWVTLAWCAFFAAQLAASAGLLAAGAVDSWSMLINLLNLPLILAMMLAEFGCRLVLFRSEPRTGLVATLVGLRNMRGMPGGRT